MIGCSCHDVAVFGHQESCRLGLGPAPLPWRDWKREIAERALDESLAIVREYDRAISTTMPRSKYAVIGGWLKKRG